MREERLPFVNVLPFSVEEHTSFGLGESLSAFLSESFLDVPFILLGRKSDYERVTFECLVFVNYGEVWRTAVCTLEWFTFLDGDRIGVTAVMANTLQSGVEIKHPVLARR